MVPRGARDDISSGQLGKHNVVEKPRRAHERRNRDQRAAGHDLHCIQVLRIHDLEVVQPD